MKRIIVGGVLAGFVLASCAGASDPDTGETPAEEASPDPTGTEEESSNAEVPDGESDADDAASGTEGEGSEGAEDHGPLSPDAEEWERVVAAAQEEGSIVVSGLGAPPLREGITQGFEDAYGISVEYVSMNSGELAGRARRESAANAMSLDVAIAGAPTCHALAEEGLLSDISQHVIDPELFDASLWRHGGMNALESTRVTGDEFYCGLQFSSWVMTDLFVNSDEIDPQEITSWEDLLKPEYEGKIAAYEPTRSGPGMFTASYLGVVFGEEYVEELFTEQDVTTFSDHRQLAEAVARGTHPIGIALVQNAVEPLRAQGLPLDRVFPEDAPGILTTGFGNVLVFDGGPHPNAATVFVNWIASQEAQEMYESAMAEMSLREDVPHDVPEYVKPQPGVEYPYDQADPEYFFEHERPWADKLRELLER